MIEEYCKRCGQAFPDWSFVCPVCFCKNTGLEGQQVVPSRGNGILDKLLTLLSTILPPTPARVRRAVIWLSILLYTIIFWIIIIYVIIWAMSA